MRVSQYCRLLSVPCVSVIALSCAAIALFAEPKKDVSDPVLQEILSSFESRMPRFIERHGKDLFVTDEPVTRGSLMSALYEYDKSLKIPRKDFVTRQELDELKEKMAQSAASRPPAPQTAKGGGKIDIMEIINDLQPNMPILLDNSLNNSKVFNSLKQEVMNRPGGASLANAGSGVELTRADIEELEKRVARIEKGAALNSRYGGDAHASSDRETASKQELSEIRNKLALLERNMSAYRAPAPDESEGPKVAARDLASKQELNEVRSKLALLEKNVSSLGNEETAAPAREGVTRQDLASKQELNEMRGRLALLEKKASSGGESGGESAEERRLKKEIEQTKREMEKIDRRIAELESS
ncbi:MAG: hypothetical protein ACYC5N_10050, partial [Endomicrobiales bacterium]